MFSPHEFVVCLFVCFGLNFSFLLVSVAASRCHHRWFGRYAIFSDAHHRRPVLCVPCRLARLSRFVGRADDLCRVAIRSDVQGDGLAATLSHLANGSRKGESNDAKRPQNNTDDFPVSFLYSVGCLCSEMSLIVRNESR